MDDKEAPQVTFLDNPHAPEVFSSCVTGFLNLQGNIAMTFESARVDHVTTPGPVNRVVIARLVMPAAAAHDLAVKLFDFLAQQGYKFDQPAEGSVQ